MKKSVQAFSVMVVSAVLFVAAAAAEPPKFQTPNQKVPVAQDRQPIGPHLSLAATLSVDPANQAANCPATIGFKGKITLTSDKLILTSPVVVQYRFKRSDGVVDPDIKTVTFTKPGSQDVSHTWGKLGGESNRALLYCGWESIEILSPQKVESNQASFTLQCLNVQQPDLKITDLFSVPLGNNKCDVGAKIKNFGGPIRTDFSSTCPNGNYSVKYQMTGTWCNGLKMCISTVAPIKDNIKNTGGEDTYTGFASAFITDNFNQASPFTLRLRLTRQFILQGVIQPAWQGNEFSMTKALTCP